MEEPKKPPKLKLQMNQQPNLREMLSIFSKLCELSESQTEELTRKQIQDVRDKLFENSEKNNLKSDAKKIIPLIDKLISNFDNIKKDKDYITKKDIREAITKRKFKSEQALKKEAAESTDDSGKKQKSPAKFILPEYYDFQDPKEITPDQLKSPIDIRI